MATHGHGEKDRHARGKEIVMRIMELTHASTIKTDNEYLPNQNAFRERKPPQTPQNPLIPSSIQREIDR